MSKDKTQQYNIQAKSNVGWKDTGVTRPTLDKAILAAACISANYLVFTRVLDNNGNILTAQEATP